MSAPIETFELTSANFSRVKYQDAADALKASPGQWAKVITVATPERAWCHQHAIQSGRRAAFRPKGSFEAHASGCDVFVRYVASLQPSLETA